MAGRCRFSSWSLVLVFGSAFGWASGGCGSNEMGGNQVDTDAGAQSSGVPGDKKLVDLTQAERAQICDWSMGKLGGYGVTCNTSDWTAMSYPDQAACVDDAPTASTTPDCTATVKQDEACVSSLKPCSTLEDIAKSAACAAISGC